jgi:hypothetical protein
MMFCHYALALFLFFVSSALGMESPVPRFYCFELWLTLGKGVTITAPANGAVIPANGYHQISWTHSAYSLDPDECIDTVDSTPLK